MFGRAPGNLNADDEGFRQFELRQYTHVGENRKERDRDDYLTTKICWKWDAASHGIRLVEVSAAFTHGAPTGAGICRGL
jgi:hypothetical protein